MSVPSDVCAVYGAAVAAKDEVVTVSIDEMTGIQALERLAPSLPMRPGKVERREFEYLRHGTQTLIAAFDVATGQVTGVVGDTRTEADFRDFLAGLFASAAPTLCWRVVCDNLNTHLSDGVLRPVAEACRIEPGTWGRKGKARVLAHEASRGGVLRDPSPRITFHYTPRPAAWLNQVEIWFSILV